MTIILSLLIVGVAFVVWRIARHITATYQHVDEDLLRDFWTNKLKYEDPKEHQRVIDHLGQCEACRRLLDDIRDEKLVVEQKLIDRRF